MKALALLQMCESRGLIRPSRLKDFKTSLQKLADAAQIPLSALDLGAIALTYQDTLQAYFTQLSPQPSPHTQRNTFQNLAQLYRLTQATPGLRRSRPGKPDSGRLGYREANRAMKGHSPYSAYYHHPRYSKPMKAWPEDIAQSWQDYKASIAFEVKDKTLQTQDDYMRSYMGFNLTIDQPPIERWDQIFETARLLRFITWHAELVSSRNKKTVRTTQLGIRLTDMLAAIAFRLERPEAPALRKFRRKLPKAPPMHQTLRPEHHFTLAELDAVGLQIMGEAQIPLRSKSPVKYPGLRAAIAYQTGLLVRLWIRLPMRSRAMREMDIDGRLYRDGRERWRLEYRGDDLKVDEMEGETNIFTVPWPADLTENLETYLREYRPRFPNASTVTELFLNSEGRPFTQDGIWARFRIAIFQSTRKRIWPHLVRTIWTDAYLDAHPGDWEGAAAMLNNSPMMVMQKYRRFRREQHLQKGLDFTAKIFGRGPRAGTSPTPLT